MPRHKKTLATHAPMRPQPLLRALAAIVALGLLSACGTKGPLYLPQKTSALPAATVAADDSSVATVTS